MVVLGVCRLVLNYEIWLIKVKVVVFSMVSKANILLYKIPWRNVKYCEKKLFCQSNVTLICF